MACPEDNEKGRPLEWWPEISTFWPVVWLTFWWRQSVVSLRSFALNTCFLDSKIRNITEWLNILLNLHVLLKVTARSLASLKSKTEGGTHHSPWYCVLGRAVGSLEKITWALSTWDPWLYLPNCKDQRSGFLCSLSSTKLICYFIIVWGSKQTTNKDENVLMILEQLKGFSLRLWMSLQTWPKQVVLSFALALVDVFLLAVAED